MFNVALIVSIIALYFLVYNNHRIKEKKRKDLFLLICFIIFFILVGFRSFETGNDTQSYLESFNESISLRWDYLSRTRFESGFAFLEVVIGSITSNNRIFLLIFSALFNISVYFFIKRYSDNYLLSVLMYVCLLFFYFSMTALRQFCAIIIVLFAFRYVKSEKLIPFILLILLATTFHVTSIICLLLYPMYKIGFSRFKSIILILFAIIIMQLLSNMSSGIFSALGWDYSYDVRMNDYSLANFLYFLTYFSMFVLSLFLYNRRGNCRDRNIEFYINIFLISALINLVAMRMNVLARLSDYFTIFSIIALPNIIHETCIRKKELDMCIIIIPMLVLYSTTIVLNKPEWNSAFDYKLGYSKTHYGLSDTIAHNSKQSIVYDVNPNIKNERNTTNEM